MAAKTRSKGAAGTGDDPPPPTPRAKSARRTTPSPETLAGLGQDRLIGLVLDETARNPAFKKLVSAALAALQGPEAVAAIVDRRLAALEGGRSYIDWQKRRAFNADLDATISVILNELRPLDRPAALDRLVRFLDGADAVLNRVDDSSGATQGLYERASEAVLDIAAALPPVEAEHLAKVLMTRFVVDPIGPFGLLFRDLITRLPDAALDAIEAGLAEVASWQGSRKGPEWERNLHRIQLLRARQDIADRRRDVDAYMSLETAILPERPDVAAVAERLLAADRPKEALDWIRRPLKGGPRLVTRADLIAGSVDPQGPERARRTLEIRILDALSRAQEAQAARWRLFEAHLDGAMLRDYLAKLPDFEDEEALQRAFAHAEAVANPHRALAFLVAWPDLDRAASLVLGRLGDWRGDHYTLLAPAADALAEGHPLAATYLYRRLLDDILAQGRSAAYSHGARYLLELDALADRLEPGAVDPDPDKYRAGLRKAHGRKSAFWSFIDV